MRKILALTLLSLFSISAHATSMTCIHENNGLYTATVKFSEAGLINEITVLDPEGSELYFSSDDEDDEAVRFGVTERQLKKNDVLSQMKSKAKLGNKKYSKVDLHAVFEKGTTGNITDVTDGIFYDEAGHVLLKFKDSNNKLVGASLFLETLGFYSNCK